MPHEHERKKTPMPEGKDRRVKLNDTQRERIRQLHKAGASMRQLACSFSVSRRLIDFICHPEKLERNKECRQQRGGWRQYYDKENHRETMKEHRHYKKEVIDERVKNNG